MKKIQLILVNDVSEQTTYVYKAGVSPSQTSNLFRDCRNTLEAFAKAASLLHKLLTPVILTLILENGQKVVISSKESGGNMYIETLPVLPKNK